MSTTSRTLLLFTLLIMITLVLAFGAALAQQEDGVPVTVFVDEDSLSVYVPSRGVVSLAGLGFRWTEGDETESFYLDEFPAFAIPFDTLPTPVCFRLVRADTELPPPPECAVAETRLIEQPVEALGTFWFSPALTETRTLLLLNEESVLDLCPAQQNVCMFTYQAGAPAGEATPEFAALLEIASELVEVEGGTFTLGTSMREVEEAVAACLEGYGGEAGACDIFQGEDAVPPHPVELTPFAMEITEVSYTQYVTFLNTLGPDSHLMACGEETCIQTTEESENSLIAFDGETYTVLNQAGNLPVTEVTWFGAQAYCEALERRLPTEAEWERAARGSDDRIYPWGDTWNPALASTNRPLEGNPQVLLVESFTAGASPFEVLNMAGNVSEWVHDWYSATFYLQQADAVLVPENPTGPLSGTQRVVRGGSWNELPFFARTVQRQMRQPSSASPLTGFRCVEGEPLVAPATPTPVPMTPSPEITPEAQPEIAPTATLIE
ncbi:MAG: formylglycine-generating enzyme family protein [Chloroflexi bacterium]|nr:formylglycine-generating enzyme family protein [Chloroflexota bacterium]